MARPLSLLPFDVVVVPFSSIDRPVEKRRPALVISHAEVEVEHGWVWLAMITSTQEPLRLGDVPVGDLTHTGLARPCRVRAAKLVTLDRARVLRRTGALSNDDRRAVAQALVACAGW